MDKAELTKGQLESIELHLETMKPDEIMDAYIGKDKPKTMSWHKIQELRPSILARALYVGFELKQLDQVITVTKDKKAKLLLEYGEEVFEGAAYNRGMVFALTTLEVKVVGITE